MTRVIGIVSGKGGVGKTAFATNFGIALSNFGKKVVVIDCNITTPHLAYYLGVSDFSTTLNSVLEGDVDIDFAPLNQRNVMFIPASDNLGDLIGIDIKNLKKYVDKLKDSKRFDYIILDSAPGLGREAMSVLESSDEIIFVTTPTVPNVTDVTRCAEVATQFKHKKYNIVFNMVRGKEYELKEHDAEKMFKIEILGSISFDTNVLDSTAQGMPILWFKPNSRAAQGYIKVTATFLGIEYKTPLLQKISSGIKNFTSILSKS